ncbi:hypothetical protein BTJ39_14555 [Izhakiella australiensis]|uniref:Uncharacterized protein n=1 Tax=Izhakiella australiensis TaxID=1926881 RepID=A0A1S8YJU2_9GAMM|nr:hypothetical protein BTJ39_14555 [Izhakiella australiensis]
MATPAVAGMSLLTAGCKTVAFPGQLSVYVLSLASFNLFEQRRAFKKSAFACLLLNMLMSG